MSAPRIEEAAAWPPDGYGEYALATDDTLFDRCIGPLYCTPASAEGVKAFAFRVTARLKNLHGVVHGGALMTILDSMMGTLAKEKLGGRLCSTISMTTDFIGAARIGDELHGEATLLRLGRAIAFTEARIHCEGRPIVTASAKWAIGAAD
jgi:uncharacterized protein (TIGR00369 family)